MFSTFLNEVSVGEEREREKYGLIYEKYNLCALGFSDRHSCVFCSPLLLLLLLLLLFVMHMMNAWAHLSKTAAESTPLIKVKRNSPLFELVAVLGAPCPR